MSNVPKQIADQLKQVQAEADAAAKAAADAMKAQQQQAQPLNQPTDQPPVTTPPPDNPNAPATVQQVEPPAGNVNEELQQKYDELEQRYRSLSGMLPARDRRIRELEQLINDMKNQAQQVTPANPAPVTGKTAEFSDDALLKRYGQTRVDALGYEVLRTMAVEQAETEARIRAELDARLRAEAEKATKANHQSLQDRFYADLGKAVPDYAEVNNDQRFLDWLNAPIEGIAGARQRALDIAASNFDANGVAGIFNAFKASLVKPPVKPPANRPSLASQVVPSPVPGSPAPAAPKPTYTVAQIQDLSDNCNRGRYPAAKAKEVREEITAAFREGRVIG